MGTIDKNTIKYVLDRHDEYSTVPPRRLESLIRHVLRTAEELGEQPDFILRLLNAYFAILNTGQNQLPNVELITEFDSSRMRDTLDELAKKLTDKDSLLSVKIAAFASTFTLTFANPNFIDSDAFALHIKSLTRTKS